MANVLYEQIYSETRKVIEGWVAQQVGHGRCHYYPELFEKLAALYSIDVPKELKNLPSRGEFEDGCAYYQDLLFGKKDLSC